MIVENGVADGMFHGLEFRHDLVADVGTDPEICPKFRYLGDFGESSAVSISTNY